MATSNFTTSAWHASMKRPKRGVPEGLWQRCPGCQATIFRKEAEKRLGVCPECDYHWYVSAASASRKFSTKAPSKSGTPTLQPADPLGFVDKKPYPERSKPNKPAPACATPP